MQIQIDKEYDWSDLRHACMTIKKGFFKNREYKLEDIIDVAKSIHHTRMCGWEGWIATGHEPPFSGK
jgi:hypothetical protein